MSTLEYVQANTPPLPDYLTRDQALVLCAYTDRTARAEELGHVYNGDFTFGEVGTRASDLRQEAEALLTHSWPVHEPVPENPAEITQVMGQVVEPGDTGD